MLDEESVKAYKSIHLARDLRAEILDRHARSRTSRTNPFRGNFLRPLGAVCSLLLVSAVVLSMALHGQTGIYTAGTKVSETPRTAATETVKYTDTRMRVHLFELTSTDDLTVTADDCLALTAKFGKDVLVEVSDGALLFPDESGNLLYAGFSGMSTEGDTFYWSLTGCEASSPLTAHFTDPDGMSLGSVTLTYVNTDGVWMISCDTFEN